MKFKILLVALTLSGLFALQATEFNLSGNQSTQQDKPKKGKAKSTKKPAKKTGAKSTTPKVSRKLGDTITTPSGLKYVLTKIVEDGKFVKNGDKVTAHYTGTLTNGKKFDSSRDGGRPFSFTVGAGQVIAGWDEGFTYLKKGETAILIIPAALGYGEMAMGDDIPANSTLIFDVEVVDISEPHQPYNGAGKDTIKLSSGLKYIIIDKGDETKKAKDFTTGSVLYAGYLMDGSKFDSNFESNQPFDLSIKNAGVIEGWKQMLPLMNKGMKVKAIIPGNLAYGQRGYPGVIPPNATLIFDMYMVDLK